MTTSVVSDRTIAASSQGTFQHDPDEVLDYAIDWVDELNGTEAIVESTFHGPHDSTTFGKLTLRDDDIGSPAEFTTFWLEGGNPGQTYMITNHIVTDEGREMDGTFYVAIVSK